MTDIKSMTLEELQEPDGIYGREEVPGHTDLWMASPAPCRFLMTKWQICRKA